MTIECNILVLGVIGGIILINPAACLAASKLNFMNNTPGGKSEPAGPSAENLITDVNPDDPGLLLVKPAGQWMELERSKPAPKMLFGEFWMQDELCILFADSNTGKSILAVQLADSISRGEGVKGFALDAAPGRVLYIDFELSTKQFEMRYTDDDGHTHLFHPNLYRAEVDLQAPLPKNYLTYTDFMVNSINQAITATGAQVLIIDNITCLGGSTDRSASALHMMQALKQLKTTHGLSILVLAHTPKRNLGRPITQNDLGGSKMLINFADSAFTMGTSGATTNCRYLKQIKQRAAAQKYGYRNVSVIRLEKTNGFLHFQHVGQALECLHLHKPAHRYHGDLVHEAERLQTNGYTQRQIAELMCKSPATVNRMLAEVSRRNAYDALFPSHLSDPYDLVEAGRLARLRVNAELGIKE